MQESNNSIDFKGIVDKKTNNDIYTNLDSILDTRLATIYHTDKNIYKEIMNGVDNVEKYLSRKTDSFGILSNNIFKALYKRRNKQTISIPLPNSIPLLIHSYIASILETSTKIPKLYLNVYPYALDNSEKVILSKNIQSIYKNMIDVEILDKPEKDITIKFIHENIGLMIMYNGLKWIEYHMSNRAILSLNIPDVTMIAPKILDNNIFRGSEIDNIFKDQEKTLQPFIQLVFITARAFSLRIDTKKK